MGAIGAFGLAVVGVWAVELTEINAIFSLAAVISILEQQLYPVAVAVAVGAAAFVLLITSSCTGHPRTFVVSAALGNDIDDAKKGIASIIEFKLL